MDQSKFVLLEKLGLKKADKKRKNQEQNKIQIGKGKRTFKILLSYFLMLAMLCTSFFAAAYFYWFGKETANHYWETERFQQRLESRIKKAAPALKQYFSKGIWEDNEMVEIYALTENTGKKKEQNKWEKIKSYTCESGSIPAGFQTNLENTISEPTIYYEKKEDKFVHTSDPDSHFIERWESQYQGRSNQGIQKYCAVSKETMREWILTYGYLNEDTYYEIPYNAYYITCDYSFLGEPYTMLCYSKKKDLWYYLTGLEKKAFHMPDMVYFPLYGVSESGLTKTVGKEKGEILFSTMLSDGFASSNLLLQDGILYNRKKLEKGKEISEKTILKGTPFFNLRTVLYQAGKEYYHQKDLLRYIDKKMNGYLWCFTFNYSLENDMEIGFRDKMLTSNTRSWKISTDYEEVKGTSKEQLSEDLKAIAEQQGYNAIEVELALPFSQHDIKTLLFSSMKDPAVKESIRYYLENMVFSIGTYCIGFAILFFVAWLYLIINLFFGKKLKDTMIEEGQQDLFYVKALPIEFWVVITGITVLLIKLLTKYVVLETQIFISIIFVFFFDITLVYFLVYAIIISIISISLKNFLWENSIIIQGGKQIWKAWQNFSSMVWEGFGYKKKALLLFLGYIMGNFICIIGGLFFFSMAKVLFAKHFVKHFHYQYYGNWNYFFAGLFFLLFLFLQIKAISYISINEIGKEKITAGLRELSLGNLEYGLDMYKLTGKYLEMAELLPKIRDGLTKAIQKSLRDERMKTELITNVSHDIKTPLTSIINYIDLLKRAKPQGQNVEHYLDVLTQKSQRLKQLIEDLVEASKASSGALPLENRNLDLTELIQQAVGEFEEKLTQKDLQVFMDFPQVPIMVFADGRRMFRILENLLQNVYKYAMEKTRVYLSLIVEDKKKAVLTLRNISAAPLNISEEELTERFVRGEASRTTEGSGLGLSIAKDLTKLQKGEFLLKIDGDLFKVVLIFPIVDNIENDTIQ